MIRLGFVLASVAGMADGATLVNVDRATYDLLARRRA
jgi:hypothetical protein